MRVLPIRPRPDFALFSKVMREGLSTDPSARSPGNGLSGPIFSGAVDCADLVNSFQGPDPAKLFRSAERNRMEVASGSVVTRGD